MRFSLNLLDVLLNPCLSCLRCVVEHVSRRVQQMAPLSESGHRRCIYIVTFFPQGSRNALPNPAAAPSTTGKVDENAASCGNGDTGWHRVIKFEDGSDTSNRLIGS